MAGATRLLATATVGSLMVVGTPVIARAQAQRSPASASGVRTTPSTSGAILGVVQDEHRLPIADVVVSALGATTTIAITDKNGHFEFGSLPPGPYLLRAHLAGYVAPRAQTVRVSPRGQATSAITLSQSGSAAPILAAGVSGTSEAATAPTPAPAAPDTADAGSNTSDDNSETAWRIRHARRGVLKDVIIPVELLAEGDGDQSGSGAFVPIDFLGKAVGSPARLATSLFGDTEFSGQVNLLTTGSFDTPQEFFSTDILSRNIAYVRLGAPVGSEADWTARGAVNQSDISSWIVAGSYTTRATAARHRYDIGLSYSTQRYDGGNLLALRDVSDGSRNVGTVYGYDSFSVTPALTFSYGGAYSRYDYLKDRSLISPRFVATLTPAEQLRVSATVSRLALAPGAEEFLPPGDTGIWLPPQRTFSSLTPRGFDAEETTHAELAVERDFGGSTLAVRAFRQHVDDQLVTLFGADMPGQPAAKLGHYVVGTVGDVDANGCAASFRTLIAGRVRGSLEYSIANAQMMPTGDLRYLVVVAPSAIRPSRERVYNLATSIETEVPETNTRVLVLYRVGNGFARPASAGEATGRPGLDGRFDVQVRQSLPFMNFSSARWEMLLAVRNFFREIGAEQSVYDELLVVRPPKRVVGGVTLRF